MKFISPSSSFGDFSNAVASFANDNLDADFLTTAKGCVEIISRKNDLTIVGGTEKKSVLITSEINSSLITDVESHLRGIVEKAEKKIDVSHVVLRQQMRIF